MFCPTAVLSMESSRPKLLQDGYIDIIVRDRLSTDGGQSIRASQKHTRPKYISKVQTPNYQRIKANELPALGSLVPRPKRPQAQISSSFTSVAVNGNGSLGQVPSPTSTPPPSKILSKPPTTQKRQRTGYDGAVDTDSEDSEPDATPATCIVAIPGNAYHPSTNGVIFEDDLELKMYDVAKRVVGPNPGRDPSGYLATLLTEIEDQLQLPKQYLSTHPLASGCVHDSAKTMMQHVLRRYYDDLGISNQDRVRWLQS